MATVQRYVNTASTPGGDGTTNETTGATRAYASLSEWEANVSGAATDDFIVDCCGTAADTTPVDVNFATDITTGSILIRGNRSDPAGFYNGTEVISANHYRLSGTLSTDGYMLRTLEPRTTIDGIQVQATRSSSSGSGAFRLIKGEAAGEFTARNNRCLGLNNGANIGGGIGSSLLFSGQTATFENNLVVSTITGIDRRVTNGQAGTITVLHNTVYGTNTGSGNGINIDRGTGAGSVTVNIKGNASANNAGSDIANLGSQGTATLEDNATEDTTGDIQSIIATDAWTSPGLTASSVFTVKNTSSALYSAVSPTLLTEDLTEFTRDGANHDVGALEFQGGGGGGLAAGAESFYLPGGLQPQTNPLTISKW